MKRNCCSKCHYPNVTCVCSYLDDKIVNQTKVLVLQHPDEANLAKNTARLLALLLNNINIVVGESEADFQEIKHSLANTHCAILYPCEKALTVEQAKQNLKPLDTLIVIDGTWKKANKIIALNPWLLEFPALTFSHVPTNQYRIRKAEQSYSLSTLEAVGLFLAQFESLDQTPLLTLLNGMIEQQTKLMPEHVKSRYFP